MSTTVAEVRSALEAERHELMWHDERFGLGANGKKRLAEVQRQLNDQTEAELERRDEIAVRLAEVTPEKIAALEEFIEILKVCVAAADKAGEVDARYREVRRSAMSAGLHIDPPDALHERAVRDRELRDLLDRAQGLTRGRW